MKHFNKSISIKSFKLDVKVKAHTVIYMQCIFKELLFIELCKNKNVSLIFEKLRMYYFTFSVIPLYTPRVPLVPFHIFLKYSIY